MDAKSEVETAGIPVGLSLVKSDVPMDHVILPAAVREVVEEFIEEQENNERYLMNGVPPRSKMMLMGPPGNGKTALCKAISNRTGYPLYFVRYDALISTQQGETSRRLLAIFEYVKARHCILFFDEIDAIGKDRSSDAEAGDMKRLVSTLLVQLDDVPPNVIVLGATNHPEMLDKAIWRRFHIRVLLPNPDTDGFVRYLSLAFARYGYEPFKEPSGVPTDSLRVTAIRIQSENFSEAEVFVQDSIRRIVRNGDLSIEEAIREALAAWPRTRMKIPS